MKHRSKSALPAALCVLALAAAASSAAPATPPDTPPGRRMAALLAAFETGTPDAIRAFVQANFAASSQKEVPLEQRVGRLGGMAKEIGPLEFDRVLKGEAPDVSFLARSKKTGEWLEVGMRLEPAPPFGIVGLRFENSEGPGAEVATPLGSDAAVAAKAGETLRALSEKGAFSGVVLLARNGVPFFLEAYGSADRDFGVPNRKDTKFNLGSINKIFTQASIAQLAAAGRLSLSDTIRRHLPDYPNPAADRITIQELVTMTSGLGDIFGKKYDATPKARLRTLADFLPLFVDEPLLFEPGTSRRYSNAGYVVLGLIIEKASGQSYHDYVREHLFRPAGMKDTDAYAQDAIVPNRAVGYTRETEGDAPPAPRRAAPRQRLCAAGRVELGRRWILDRGRPPRLRPGDARQSPPLPRVDRLVLLGQGASAFARRARPEARRRFRLRRRNGRRQRLVRVRSRRRRDDRRALESRSALGRDRDEEASRLDGTVGGPALVAARVRPGASGAPGSKGGRRTPRDRARGRPR